jgi:hypothetical protein
MEQPNEIHQAQFAYFEELLADDGIATQFFPAGGEIPLDTLVVALPASELEDQSWQIELSFLPGLEEDLDDVSLLQCFVPIVERVEPSAAEELLRFILTVNITLPLGSFGHLPEPGVTYLKYNCLIPHANEPAGQIVSEMVYMIGYMLDMFAPSLDEVALGHISAEEALQRSLGMDTE